MVVVEDGIEEQDSSSGRIVVGVDGSPSSVAALRWAADLAPAIGGSIEAVICWEYPIFVGWEPAIPSYRPDADAESVLTAAIDAAFGGAPPVGMLTSVREGHAAAVLVAASRGARMLVVGSRGHGGFPGLLLGSVSTACAEHAKCPVLVVHGGSA